MSPEQVKGEKPDALADVWSAGVVLYEMSTGRRPFGPVSGARLACRYSGAVPGTAAQCNPAISQGLERVILRALQKDPGERYQSAGDLRIDLENLMTGKIPVHARLNPRVFGC